jgi:hypothetical protein
MRIIQLAGIEKEAAGRKIKVIIVANGKGERRVYPLPDQGLGESCHQLVDKLNPGVSTNEKTWTDDRPEDEDVLEQNVQI